MIMKYTIQQAKRDFELGYLKNYQVERCPMRLNQWRVYVFDLGDNQGVLVDFRTKNERHFKSIDAAVSALESIGFEINILGS